MKRLLVFTFLICLFLSAFSQGKVLDAATGEPLSSASIILFSSGKKTGLVANKEGVFSFTSSVDSIRVSMVGYRSKTVFAKKFSNSRRQLQRQQGFPAKSLAPVWN